MVRPIAIDLFSGAGGLSLGLEMSGFDVVAAIDVDPIHCAVHHFNFPTSKTICASVTDISGQDIIRAAGIEVEVDLVVGGAPCQGFSMIGKRALDDPRNELVFHFVRLVTEIQPKYFLFENVKGLTQGRHRTFLEELITEFQERGYQIRLPYRVLNAADYGVPQKRERLILLGAREALPLPEYPEKCLHSVTVRDAIGDLPDADRFGELLRSDEVEAQLAPPSPYAAVLRGIKQSDRDYSYPRYSDNTRMTSSTRTLHTPESTARYDQTQPGKTEPVSRFKRLEWGGLSNTLRAGTDSERGAHTAARPIHPEYPRVITVREAARLHSYPDSFRFHTTKWHGFRQVGNSVPPLLAAAISAEIIRVLDVNPTVPETEPIVADSRLLKMSMDEAARKFGVGRDVIPQRRRSKPEIPGQLSYLAKEVGND